ncbi:hypothetical protein QWY85_03420 [Neolewinella lacunae]|uniref:Anti-sigma factor n=1 Tax=Neolewinella lacunae TaxID=1517758 RepID=A0A923PHZ3_9BACT|nr:hypothetical protein [Neolewinella lacunae]MBC6992945.1 hypothetical protein [Neolewinella lacunae]MDN3633691.1 hypothetical protein [Neolewinella lacunae]
MLDDRDIELLEAYTYGEVSPEEERTLRSRLLDDPAFASAVRQWELMEREGFVATPTQATRDLVKEALDEKRIDPPATESNRAWLWYAIIALLLLLTALLAWKWLSGTETTTTSPPPTEQATENTVYADLVKEYFRHLPSENFHLGSEQTLEERALAAYEARDYATALPLLLETVATGGDSLNLLYAGVAALGMGDGERAMIYLDLVVSIETLQAFREEATYFRALSFISNGDVQKARKLIEENSNNQKFSPLTKLKDKIYD